MIHIKETDLPNSIKISILDKYIGVVGSNKSDTKIFSFPSRFKGMNLDDDKFTFMLKVQPVNKTEKSYYEFLEKDIIIGKLEDTIQLLWEITRTHTKEAGNLQASIQIYDVNEDIIWESFKYEFTVVSGIDAYESMVDIPPSIIEQLVNQAGVYAGMAKSEADRAKEEADKIIGLVADGTIELDIGLEEEVTVAGVSVGNIADGDVLEKDMSFTAFVKKMLIKMIPPVYISPKLSISSTSTKSVEVGTSINTKITPTFTQNDGGIVQSYILKMNGTNIYSDLSEQEYNVPQFNIGDESVNFVAECSYTDGLIKMNNLGEPYPDGHILAGTVSSNLIMFTGYRNAFYGSDDVGHPVATSSDVRGLNGSVLGAVNGSEFTINVPAGHRRICIAYPSYLRDLTSISYVEQGNASYEDIFLSNKEIINVGGVNGYSPISYSVYSWIPAIPFTSNMTLHVII